MYLDVQEQVGWGTYDKVLVPFCFHQQCQKCIYAIYANQSGLLKRTKILVIYWETRQVFDVWPALVPGAHYSSSPPSLACMCLSWTFWVIPSDERVPCFSFSIFFAWEQTWHLSNVLHKKVSICSIRSKRRGAQYHQIKSKSLTYWTHWLIDLDDLLILDE